MTVRDTTPTLTPDDSTFVRRLNRAYAPPPMGAEERAAFDRRLRARLERPSRVRPSLLIAATAMVAALLWVAMGRPGGVAVPPGAPEVASGAGPAEEMAAVLAVYDWATTTTTDLAMVLPADYQVLAADYLDR